MEERKIISEITKDNDTVIRITVSEFKGQEYVDVRAYVKNQEGEFIPTKKGITVSKAMLPKLLEGLNLIK